MLCLYVFLLTNRERKQSIKYQRFSSQINDRNQLNFKFGKKGNDSQQNPSTTATKTREEDIVNLTSKIPMATAPGLHINRARELGKSFGNNKDSVKWYFTKRNESIANFRYDFLYTSNTTCSEGESPFLTILCLTQVHHDTYENLTIKVIMGLRWLLIHCPGTKYVLKVDEDTFIHVANLVNLVNFLKTVDKSQYGIVIGWVWSNSLVRRHGGKWSIPNDIYPFKCYPQYTSGGAYILSGNIIGPLLDAAEYLPTIINEDAFITGVARTVVGAEIQHSPDFDNGFNGAPRPCSFKNDHKITATNTNVNLNKRIWTTLNTTMKSC